jgi:hypothetical protein
VDALRRLSGERRQRREGKRIIAFSHGSLHELGPGGFRNERLEIQPTTITEHVFDAK